MNQPNEAKSPTTVEPEQTKHPAPSPRPPHGPRLWVMLLIIIGLAVGFAAGSMWGPAAKRGAENAIRAASSSSAGVADEASAGSDKTPHFYTCGMHPWVILPKPGLCPICHMDLVPLDPSKFTGEISIDPVVTQNIGVRIAPVTTGPVVRTIRTVGTVAYDETRVRDVNIKVAGWIEKLYVDYEGARVRVGDPLFEFYSPQLYSSQSEYLSALQMKGKVGADFLPGSELDADRLIHDARVQLEYFDITPEQIKELEERGAPSKNMMIRSPYAGIVIAKHANEGMRVDQGMRVYQIADLSKVWVQVSMYEYQLPFIKEGQSATMSLPYVPGQKFEGRIIYIYPYLDEKTRQVNVRLEFDNPGGLLKPGMYASIELRNTLARDRTLAPRSAIIDTGERSVAFVSVGEGHFEPRNVLLGVQTDDGHVEILDGLKAGEMVVTSGQFLLDSEAKLRESLAKMVRGDLAADQKRAVAVTGQSELTTLPAEVATAIITVLDQSFAIGDLLASDSTAGVQEPSRQIAGAVDGLLRTEIPGSPHFWHEHEEIATVRGKALEISDAKDIESARLAFADLNIALSKLISATGVPPSYEFEVQKLHCPMYREGQGGSTWLQRAGPVRNPFYGSVMLGCFDERTALPVTGASGEPRQPSTAPKPSSIETPATPQLESLDGAAQGSIDDLVRAYLAMHDELASDAFAGVAAHLDRLRTSLSSLETAAPKPLRPAIARLQASTPADSGDIGAFRTAFRGMSDGMIELMRLAPPTADVAPRVYHIHCPMVEADWLQASPEVANPYDTDMPGCGTIKDEFIGVERGASP